MPSKEILAIYRDVPRAKKSLYIPAVLSREEIDAILLQLSPPYDLVVKLLFGCGLRLFECLQLRVRDFNFDSCTLTVHGKGKKDRTVPLPESITQELKTQIKKSQNSMNRTCLPGTMEYFWMIWWRKSTPRHLRILSTSGSFPRNL